MATGQEIILEVERLELHFRSPVNAAARTLWLADWITDLGPFPAAEVQEAFRKWRMDGERFPRPGQIIKLIRAAQPVPESECVDNTAWYEPSEGDYHAMSIREKRRYHLIKASICGRKVGPMFKNTGTAENPSGWYLTPEDMDVERPGWRKWWADREYHEGEAKKLYEQMKEPWDAERARQVGKPAVREPISAEIGDVV